MPSPYLMPPELESLREDFEGLAAASDALAGSLSDTQFNWSPGEGRWSMAQCIEHLNTTAREYLLTLDTEIAESIRRSVYGPGPYRYGFLARWMVRSMEPPPRRRFRAPRIFEPAPQRPRAETLAAFRAYQVQFVDRLRQANGLDLARVRVASPASKWVRLPLGAAFLMILAHERRHLWQAEQVTRQPGFPAA